MQFIKKKSLFEREDDDHGWYGGDCVLQLGSAIGQRKYNEANKPDCHSDKRIGGAVKREQEL